MTVYISEFNSVAQGIGRGAVPIFSLPPVGKQTVAAGAVSKPFSGETNFIRVNSDATCSILVTDGAPAAGFTPAAATTDMRLTAGATEYFAVTPGSVLAVIANT